VVSGIDQPFASRFALSTFKVGGRQCHRLRSGSGVCFLVGVAEEEVMVLLTLYYLVCQSLTEVEEVPESVEVGSQTG